jgi:Flp pilus assembly protein TadD
MQDPFRDQAEALFHLGNQHMAEGDFPAAEKCLRQAIDLAPDFNEALTNLGFLLDQRGDIAGAEATYQQARHAGADSFQLHMNLGALLALQKRFGEAEHSYAEALRCNPASSAVWSNLGVLYLGVKNETTAEACLQKALELDPANAKALFNLGYLCLRQGRFEEGWRCLESRDWYASLEQHFTMPRWQGECMAGKSIVIGYEAGHGDVIQFARYIPLVKALGATHITLVCHPALKPLMLTLAGVSAVIGFNDTVPRAGWDYWTPLISLPFHMKTRADSIPANIPYLWADDAAVAHWAARLPAGQLRVGLVWKGNPHFENDAERSLPGLQTLAPLWAIPGISFVSLQKGAGEEELEAFGAQYPLVDLGTHMDHFADAAAMVASLDLVICVDTAMAHLAGALGKPCWVMLPDFMTDWRWRSEGTESAWYPGSLRLFRQQQRGNWSEVVHELAAYLSVFAGRPGPCDPSARAER